MTELMLGKLGSILAFALVAFFLAIVLYPGYIKLLKHFKVKKTIRSHDVTGKDSEIFAKLHAHKAGTPTMGGGLFLFILLVMVGISFALQKFGIINYNLYNQQETYLLLFGFFSMGVLGLVDDVLNVMDYGKVKGLNAKAKLLSMLFFSGFIAYWFYIKLGVDTINLWPIAGEVHIGIFAPLLFFFLTIAITNAINITDGLDGLAGGLMTIILFTLGVVTFVYGTYLATTILLIVIAVLGAFLWFNINPAKIFMGDSGAFALGGLVSVVLFWLNMRMGILVPFFVLFLIFIIEVGSSMLQILSKKIRKKKLFAIAPFHHLLEHRGMKETTVVMKLWLVQGVLAMLTLIIVLYQISLP